MNIGVIVREEDAAAAMAAGVDYIEPHIVGNVVVQDGDTWVAGPAVKPGRRHPSFAIMFPGDVRLADPGADPTVLRDYLAAVLPVVAEVAEPGAKLVLGSGAARTTPEGVDQVSAQQRLAENLAVIVEATRSHGLEVILEPLNKGETDNINSIAEALAFLDEHGFTDVRVVADLYHIVLENESLESIAPNVARVGHAHVADTGRFAPGTGDWPIREFVTMLQEGGYAGNLTIECSFNDLAAELPAAVEFLRPLV